jgi:hypothetical protein
MFQTRYILDFLSASRSSGTLGFSKHWDFQSKDVASVGKVNSTFRSIPHGYQDLKDNFKYGPLQNMPGYGFPLQSGTPRYGFSLQSGTPGYGFSLQSGTPGYGFSLQSGTPGYGFSLQSGTPGYNRPI